MNKGTALMTVWREIWF